MSSKSMSAHSTWGAGLSSFVTTNALCTIISWRNSLSKGQFVELASTTLVDSLSDWLNTLNHYHFHPSQLPCCPAALLPCCPASKKYYIDQSPVLPRIQKLSEAYTYEAFQRNRNFSRLKIFTTSPLFDKCYFNI